MVESFQLRSFCSLSCIPFRLCLSGYEVCNLWSKPWLKEWLWMSSSVQLSHSVMSDSSRPHGLQHARLLCPSPTPKACSNSCPLSQWCHLTISSSLFLSLPPLLPPSIFPRIRVFSNKSVLHIMGPKYWSFSISPCNEYSGLISLSIGCFFFSLQSKGLSRVFSNSTQFTSINSLAHSFVYGPTLTSILDYWKNHSFDYTDL